MSTILETDLAHTSPAHPGVNTETGVEPARTSRRSGVDSERRSRSRQRRQEKKRKRERRRIFLAIGFVLVELSGFWFANFSSRNSWAELGGFLLLQPAQIALNGLDAHIQLTRGLRDEDAVLLVTLLSLPLNLLFWYGIWRGGRSVRRRQRRRRHAPGATHGAALPLRRSGSRVQAQQNVNGGDLTANLPERNRRTYKPLRK